MKQLLLLLFTIAVACYGCKQKTKPGLVAKSPDLAKAEELYNQGNDSSFYYFNQVANNSKDSHDVAVAYNYMGVIQREASDYFGSQESLLGSLKHLDENRESNHYNLFSVYTTLANNCLDLKNYDEAIGYYDLALKYSNNDNAKQYALNGKAVVYQKKKAYAEALQIYNSIIHQSLDNKKEYARIISNTARTKWLRDSTYPAESEFWTALHLRQDLKDNWGLNASYSHLSDYYAKIQPDSAHVYAQKMFAIAQLNNSPDDQVEALQKLIKLSPAKELRTHIDLYQHLNDSLQTARNNAKNQFALIRYESEKNKADKIALQKDNAEKRVQIIEQRFILYTIIALAVIFAIIAINWYKRRKLQMQRESQDAVRESQLKLSRKVHDEVANGLYGVMNILQHEPALKKEELLDKLEILYETSRDISYEKPPTPVEGFQQTVAELLTSFAGPTIKISVVGNNNGLWDRVSNNTKKELEPVLQELMVNMKKHSGARNVVVRFESQPDQAMIFYQDDGTGLPSSFQYGNGLNNTENRIKSIGGHIIFDRNVTNGLKIRIFFPIAQKST